MLLTAPLDGLLQTRSHVRILRALDEMPAGFQASTREIARRAAVSHPTASAVLEGLLEHGVVFVRRTLLATEYRLNPDHIAIKPLHALFRWERRLPQELRAFLTREIRTRAAWVSAAYLFGSAARGDMRPGSDLDLAVIVPAGRVSETEEAMERVGDLSRARFGNRVNLVIGTRSASELARRGRKASRLWQRILSEGIPLVVDTTQGRHGAPKG